MERLRLRGRFMKESEETEHRISNLKNMMNNIHTKENKKETDTNEEELEEDEELIKFLHESEFDSNFEINDEYIYHPKKDSDNEINLDSENEIDENFLIETDINEKLDENNQYINEPLDFEENLGESFDNLVNIQIGERPLLPIVSLVLGVIFIIASLIVFSSGTERIIDNVVSGENNFIMVVLLIIGLLLIFYGVYKLFNIKSPFDNIVDSMNDLEKEKQTDDKKEEKEILIPKSNIPLDKEAYKIGEFEMDELKQNLKKSFGKTSDTEEEPVNKETALKTDFKDLPRASEKSTSKNDDEEEEFDYEKADLDRQTIDEIFADVEDLPDEK